MPAGDPNCQNNEKSAECANLGPGVREMTELMKKNDLESFLEAIGLDEEPMGMYYSDGEP